LVGTLCGYLVNNASDLVQPSDQESRMHVARPKGFCRSVLLIEFLMCDEGLLARGRGIAAHHVCRWKVAIDATTLTSTALPSRWRD